MAQFLRDAPGEVQVSEQLLQKRLGETAYDVWQALMACRNQADLTTRVTVPGVIAKLRERHVTLKAHQVKVAYAKLRKFYLLLDWGGLADGRQLGRQWMTLPVGQSLEHHTKNAEWYSRRIYIRKVFGHWGRRTPEGEHFLVPKATADKLAAHSNWGGYRHGKRRPPRPAVPEVKGAVLKILNIEVRAVPDWRKLPRLDPIRPYVRDACLSYLGQDLGHHHIPAADVRKRLGKPAWIVWQALCDSRDPDTGVSHMSKPEIAQVTGMALASIKDAMTKLRFFRLVDNLASVKTTTPRSNGIRRAWRHRVYGIFWSNITGDGILVPKDAWQMLLVPKKRGKTRSAEALVKSSACENIGRATLDPKITPTQGCSTPNGSVKPRVKILPPREIPSIEEDLLDFFSSSKEEENKREHTAVKRCRAARTFFSPKTKTSPALKAGARKAYFESFFSDPSLWDTCLPISILNRPSSFG